MRACNALAVSASMGGSDCVGSARLLELAGFGAVGAGGGALVVGSWLPVLLELEPAGAGAFSFSFPLSFSVADAFLVSARVVFLT